MKLKLLHIPRKWMIFSVTATGTFMSTLDAGIVNVALPEISRQFGSGLESIQWIVSIYLLTVTCFLPVFGKLSDLYSRKKMYLFGFLLFGIGSVLCSLSHSLGMMIFARALQGLGASAMIANSQAIIAKAFSGKDRGRALGAVGAIVALGSLSGPAIGGFMIAHLGWSSIFWVNVPVCLIGIWRGILIIPRWNALQKGKLDLVGTAYFMVMCFSFLYAVDAGTAKSWTSPTILCFFGLAVLFFGLFYRRELTAKTPFIGLSIFKIPAISYGCAVAVLGFLTIFSNSILLPFYLSDILHMDPVKIGLLLLPFPVALAIAAPVSGVLSEKISARFLTTGGLLLALVASLLFAFIPDAPSISYIILAQLLMGVGSGTFQVPNNNSIITAAPKSKMGLVTSINALSRNVGMVLGVSLSVAVFSAVQSHYLMGGVDKQTAFLHGYTGAMLFAAAMAFIGALLSTKRD